ncbi:hypothetical protein TNCV_2654981 [Trichonephila clavipes]|nr:hypothetical protein TNCV_2654981 [Trichonephila clavipes]
MDVRQTANRALGKLNIFRKLRRPQSTYYTIIRPMLEYFAPIWAAASTSTKEKLDSVQNRASKIVIGEVSSTNNKKAGQECSL